jgi:hypothetical protein
VFGGKQVVRRDQRVRRLRGEIFTLPLHFQRGFGQALSGPSAVRALFVLARQAPMETFEFRRGVRGEPRLGDDEGRFSTV